MTTILRQPAAAESEHFDTVIIGGGIYGAMLLLEAARHGQRALLLERQDFGAGTSYNSLRIIHGGLRYLQSLDLVRFYESVTERRWLLHTFPDLVKPLPCLMPLYNRGIKRPAVLQAALWMNDLLSVRRNRGITRACMISGGRILGREETRQVFPGGVESGLAGAALWHDAHVPDSQRLIMETLRWACSLGAQALNYVEVTGLLQANGCISSVQARDRESGSELEIRCRNVINATGPASRAFAADADRDIPELFNPSLAWNILFDCPAPSTHALALTPDLPGGQTYFLHPWKGRLLAGTGHAPWRGPAEIPVPGAELLEQFLADLNSVLPGCPLAMNNIARIYPGFLPVRRDGSTALTNRPVIHDHGLHDGPRGLFSVSGIKLTTAHKVAEQTLQCVLKSAQLPDTKYPAAGKRPVGAGTFLTCLDYDWMPNAGDETWKTELGLLIRQESVLHLDDLVLRRTSIGDNPKRVLQLAAEIAGLFGWDESRREREIRELVSNPAMQCQEVS